MKLYIDNQLIQILAETPSKVVSESLFLKTQGEIKFGWPSFFSFIGLESILTKLPSFVPGAPLFDVCLSILSSTDNKQILLELYDRLFVESLAQIKSLPQIDAPFLLEAIREKRERASFAESGRYISNALDSIEHQLVVKRGEAIHDLTLYLAWERMCICLARLFDHQSTAPLFLFGIATLKECLIESFLHIKGDGATQPTLYRLLEALFIYEMREENLNKTNESDWDLLSRSFAAMKSQEELVDYFYVDEAVVLEDKLQQRMDMNGEALVHCLTLDTNETIDGRLAFAHYMIDKLRGDYPPFRYVLCPTKVFQVAL